MLREEETDLGFADFSVVAGSSKRLYASPKENGADANDANPANTLVELRGIEPRTLRLPEARKPKK